MTAGLIAYGVVALVVALVFAVVTDRGCDCGGMMSYHLMGGIFIGALWPLSAAFGALMLVAIALGALIDRPRRPI